MIKFVFKFTLHRHSTEQVLNKGISTPLGQYYIITKHIYKHFVR